MEPQPSRMLAVLRDCGALAQLLPEVDALYGVPQRVGDHPEIDTGVHLARALDYAAAKGFCAPGPLRACWRTTSARRSNAAPVVAEPFGTRGAQRAACGTHVGAPQGSARLSRCGAGSWRAGTASCMRRASRRLPRCSISSLAADALRRPDRLDTLLEACECDALSLPGRSGTYAPAQFLRDALATIRGVDAAAVARKIKAGAKAGIPTAIDAIPKAVRAARLKALRAWRKTQVAARALASAPPR